MRALSAALALMLVAAACSDENPVQVESNDLVATAQSAGGFSTLLAALEAAGLTSTVATGGPFTVFAPTDAAFEALPAGVLDGLLADTEALTEVLLYHVAQGQIMAADLDGASSVTTLQGQKIAVTAGSVVLNGIMVDQADIMADNGIIHVIGEVLLPPSFDLAETASETDGFSTLAAALAATELDAALAGEGPFTVFAPTDAAFADLPAGTLDALLADPAALSEILLYHVVQGEVFSRDLDGVISTGTLAGFPVIFDLSDGAKVNDANIVATNVLATNGIIHVIDEVLLPPTKDIVQTAIDAGFSTLATALTAADLVGALQADGPFTVFAPTDEAFANLPAGALSGLLADIPALTNVLLYHVVDGQVFAGDLDGVTSAPTLLMGQSVSIDLTSGVKINDATVITKDIIATNGVIHVVDTVLLPN
jgi:uncharacterized surface protein with fasciclin (FAS1) repeats